MRLVQPHVLIGITARPKTFSPPVLQQLKSRRPVVMALSNPNSCAECTPSEAFEHTQGRAVYASGSLFPDYPHNQANNMFVFPVVGKLAPQRGTTMPDDALFVDVAEALAKHVSDDDLLRCKIYPDNKDIVGCIDGVIQELSRPTPPGQSQS